MYRSTALYLATALTLAATPLLAQDAPASDLREGFHFSIGAGSGAAGITCEGCSFDFEDSVKGFSGLIRIGGAVSPHLVLGVEGMGWIKNDAPVERRIASASVAALLYPSATGGFFLKAGVGYLRAVIEDDFGWISSDAIAPQVGLGFDIPLGSGAFLTPYVNGILGTNSATSALGYNLPIALDPVVVQVGMALTTN